MDWRANILTLLRNINTAAGVFDYRIWTCLVCHSWSCCKLEDTLRTNSLQLKMNLIQSISNARNNLSKLDISFISLQLEATHHISISLLSTWSIVDFQLNGLLPTSGFNSHLACPIGTFFCPPLSTEVDCLISRPLLVCRWDRVVKDSSLGPDAMPSSSKTSRSSHFQSRNPCTIMQIILLNYQMVSVNQTLR